MNVREWAFTSAMHPVYERPPDANRWQFGLPEFAPPKYAGDRDRLTREPLIETMVGHPSVNVYQGRDKTAVQQVDLRSGYAPEMDTSEVEAEANRWLAALQEGSKGPYTSAMLARMGNPYGYGDTQKPSWARLYKPRPIPSMGPAAHLRGVGFRGRVPDRSLVNMNTGAFLSNWRLQITRWYGGLTLRFTNLSEYAWFLFHGTIHMQAHGPWGAVAERVLPALQRAWRTAAGRAWRNRQALAAQYTQDAVEAQQQRYDAGGWA